MALLLSVVKLNNLQNRITVILYTCNGYNIMYRQYTISLHGTNYINHEFEFATTKELCII